MESSVVLASKFAKEPNIDNVANFETTTLEQTEPAEVPMLKLDNNALLRNAAYIDGEWRAARSGARFSVKNPATGDVIAEVADLAEDDVKDAIEAAHRAWGPWRAKTAKERAQLMRKWYELMMVA